MLEGHPLQAAVHVLQEDLHHLLLDVIQAHLWAQGNVKKEGG